MSKSMRKGSKILALFVALIMTAFVCIDASFFAIKANAQTVISAQSIVEDMGVGWNLGNSLDAHGAGSVSGHETYWGNPVVTENLIKAVKAKGFNTVRVPVTWYEHITYNNGQYTIDPAWFARVKEVVDYAYNNGMYVILNVHHENWVNRSDLANSYDAISAELKKVWRQIAEYFADYDQHLIFEGMNEPRMEGAEGEWTGNAACYNVINKLNADFISTVRSVDSPYKTTRLLMVPGYAASADYGVYSSLDKNLFKDTYVAASVHAYKPYEFAMGDGDHSAFSSEYKSKLDSIFGDLRSFFTQNDIPVVIGEFSASNYGYTAARVEWAEYYMTLAKEIGAACVLWDNNVESGNGGESHGYINRSNNTWYSASEAVVNKLISVRNDSSIVWGSKSSYPLYSHEDYSSGTAVSTASDTVMEVAKLSGFTSKKELAIKYNSETSPIIAIANSSWGGWTEFSPYDYSYTNSYKIAYVRYDDIYGAWNSASGELYYIKVKNYDSIAFSGIKMLDIKASHTHSLADKYSSDATGHWYACSGCTEKVSFAAHTSDSGTVTKQPTATEEGEKTYKCTVCNYVIRTEPIEKLGHTHTPAQTWTSDATGHWHTCSGCTEKVSFAAHTSDSGTVTKQPTATEEGEKTYKCTVCNYVIRTEPIEKLGHTHTPAQTWTSDATGHWHTCSGCSVKVDFETHTEDSGTITKQPTATEEGEKTYKCTICNYVIRTEPIEKLGHTHTPAQTWTSDATGHWHTCSGCSVKVDFETHTEDSGTVTKNPTATEEGEKTYKCTKCKYVIRTEKLSTVEGAVSVNDGTETKTFDDLTSALKAYKASKANLTITLNTDANVKTLSLPTKAASITFEGSGALNVNATSISIPANTTFNVALNGTNTKPLAVKVSAGKTLTINSETSNIGAVSGTKTSILNVNEDVEAVSLATFGEVNVADTKTLTVTGKVSAITKLNGALKLPTAKASAATVTAGKAEIILTNGNIAKVTMTDVTDKLNVKVVNENGEIVALASGTIVLYSTKDISEKVTIANKTSDEKELNAFYYKKNKAIKAEWADAVTLSNGDTHRMFPNVELALESIKERNTDYTITLNTNVTEPKFVLPKTARSITINGTGTLTTAVTSIAAPVDTTIGCVIKQSAGRPIALKAAANTKLALTAENTFGAVSGTKTSILNVNENVTAVSLATFGEVNVAETKALTVTGKASAITKLNGTIKLPTAKTTAATVTAGKAEIILTDGNIAKVTMTDVTDKLNVKVVNENGETVDLASGTVVLNSTKDISEKVTIANKTSDAKELNAFYYKKNKAIKAEWADAVTLSYGETNRKFPNTELALESMTDKYTDYTVTLNADISASTFALPASAQSITIKSNGEEQKTINLTNITTVSAKTPLTLENVAIESTKPFAISTTSDLTLNNFTSTSITAVKGGAKAALTLGKTSPIDKVSGFGTTKVTSEFKTGTTFTTTSLELAETASLIVSNTKAPASTKTLNGAEGSCIKLEDGFTPIKVTGTTADSISGTIKLKSESEITDSTVLFTTKYAGNNVFDVSEIKPEETGLEYTVTSISGKAYMKPIVFEMSGKGYALWTDAVTIIENVKASEAAYTVKLLDDTNINGALKLPKTGTYKKLTITSENKTLKFTGSVTATGELEVVSTNLDAVRNDASAKYTLTAGRYPFSVENVELNLASISGTADVTLKNVSTTGTIKAGKLTLNGTNTVLGTVTAAELGSTEAGTVLNVLYNARGVMNVTKNGITSGSEEITIKLVDANGKAVTAENKTILASSFKGAYDNQLKLSTENGEFSIVLVNGKLVLADSITVANSAFDDIDESTDEEEAEEPNDEDTSDEDTSEEETTDDETTDDDENSDEDTSDENTDDESDDTSEETEDTENNEENDEASSDDFDDDSFTDELSA